MDFGRGTDSISVGARVPMRESGRAYTRWLIRRYDEEHTKLVQDATGVYNPDWTDFERLGIMPYNISEVVGNLITTNGWARLGNLLTNQGATQALDATHTRIGAGNGSTAEAYGDTDLAAAAGSANRWFQLVSGAGTVGTRTLAFSASFGTADGNFAWNEFGIDVGNTSSGNTVASLLFNRKAGIAQGTKASGQTWTATATITWT